MANQRGSRRKCHLRGARSQLELARRTAAGLRWAALFCAVGAVASCALRAEPRPAATVTRETALRPSARILFAQANEAEQSAVEVAAHAGLVVFGTSDGRFTMMPDCRMTGQYLYIGTRPQLRRVSLESEREVTLNVARAPNVQADAAPMRFEMYRVGRFATTRKRANRNALLGSCSGATHFARALAVGGLADANGRPTPECQAASERDAAPPAGCHVFLRADLVALDGAGLESPQAGHDPCPAGWALAAGVCVERSSSTPHECADDPGECRAQCDLGSRGSCTRLGRMLARGERGFVRDEASAMTFYAKACEAGHAAACYEMGELYDRNDLRFHDAARATSFWNRACVDGYTAACVRLGLSFTTSPARPQDRDGALSLFRRACSGGDPLGCLQAAELQGSVPDSNADQEVGAFLDLACDGDLAAGCVRFADWLRSRGAPTEFPGNPSEKACSLGSTEACARPEPVPH